MSSETKKSILWGIGGGIILLTLYFLILSLTQSFSHALEQFLDLWYLILPLVIGFGLQVFLYSYIRYQVQGKNLKAATGELAASGGVSAGAMIACCAHHLIDVLPLLGLSAVFLFLAKYQIFFLFLGITSNIIGILFLLEIIQRHSLTGHCSLLAKTMKFNLKKIRNGAILISIIFLLIAFGQIRGKQKNPLSADLIQEKTPVLAVKTNNENGLSIEATPIDFFLEKPIQIEIKFTTHQGDLNFDLTKNAVLIDDKNQQYLPLTWSGGNGGHHLSGTLVFPTISKETKNIKLIINNVYNIKERIFEWNLE